MMKPLLFVALCLVLASSRFPGYSIDLPVGTTDFDYSPDQKYIGILTESSLHIIAAINGKSVQSISFDDPLSPRSFAFSSDSNSLAIGFENGAIYAYTWDQTKFVKSVNELTVAGTPIIN